MREWLQDQVDPALMWAAPRLVPSRKPEFAHPESGMSIPIRNVGGSRGLNQAVCYIGLLCQSDCLGPGDYMKAVHGGDGKRGLHHPTTMLEDR